MMSLNARFRGATRAVLEGLGQYGRHGPAAPGLAPGFLVAWPRSPESFAEAHLSRPGISGRSAG